MSKVYFVSGIDTGIGKSYITGLLAKQWNAKGIRTITQKLVQTGCTEQAEDILLHRKIMGQALNAEDHEQLTMPAIYAYPASPHLAAQLEQRPIDLEKISAATRTLCQRYDAVLLEGAGGLMVPLYDDYLLIDYLQEQGYPLIFVTSGRLGSINHTLLSLEAIKRRNIPLHSVVYNLFPSSNDPIIEKDTKSYLQRYVEQHFPAAIFHTV